MSVDNSKLDAWRSMQARAQPITNNGGDDLLHGSGGGGTSGGMDISMKDYVDARDAATASDLKAELAFVRSDIQSVRSLIENVPTTRTFFFGLLTTGIAILGILIALMSFGGDRFAAGLGLADQRQAQLQRDVRQDETIKQTNAKLDEILKRLPAKP